MWDTVSYCTLWQMAQRFFCVKEMMFDQSACIDHRSVSLSLRQLLCGGCALVCLCNGCCGDFPVTDVGRIQAPPLRCPAPRQPRPQTDLHAALCLLRQHSHRARSANNQLHLIIKNVIYVHYCLNYFNVYAQTVKKIEIFFHIFQIAVCCV